MGFDIIGIGCAAVDDLLYVDEFPKPDAKTRVNGQDRQCGGLTAIALIAAARFGARCAYAGALGPDEGSEYIVSALDAEKIDLSLAARPADGRAIHARIIVDTNRHTRNVFFVPGVHMGAMASPALDAAIVQAKVLFVDHYGADVTVQAARLARSVGIPVVADLERIDVPCFNAILAEVDHLILSERFALHLTGAPDIESAACALHVEGRAVVVITSGAQGGCYVTRDSTAVGNYPAFPTDIVDTTGCGDVFHGVYAATLALGMPLEDRLRYASASASIKARQYGAQRGIPTRGAIEELLAP